MSLGAGALDGEARKVSVEEEVVGIHGNSILRSHLQKGTIPLKQLVEYMYIPTRYQEGREAEESKICKKNGHANWTVNALPSKSKCHREELLKRFQGCPVSSLGSGH